MVLIMFFSMYDLTWDDNRAFDRERKRKREANYNERRTGIWLWTPFLGEKSAKNVPNKALEEMEFL